MRTRTAVAGFVSAIAVAIGIADARASAHAQTQSQSQTQTQTAPPPVPVPCAFPGACAPPSSTTPKPADPAKTADPAKAADAPKTTTNTPPPRTPDPSSDVSSAPLAPPPQAVTPGAPTEQMLGVKVYPNAQFLQSVDAGRGQRYYLYGTNASYAEIVKYYQGVLRNGGRELIKMPPMQQFDLGKFQDQAMVFQPSVVVKDYTWNNSEGYLYIDGAREQRFKTVIQIVPAPAGPGR